MDKFDIIKAKKELKSAAEKSGTSAALSIQVVLNNMEMYNKLVDELRLGDSKKIYLIYQMSATIFTQLEKFGLVPPKIKDTKKKDEASIDAFINAINER